MLMLVLNIGSGSQKLTLFEFAASDSAEKPTPPIWQAKLDSTAPDQPPDELLIKIKSRGRVFERSISRTTPIREKLARLMELIWTGETRAVERPKQIGGIAHRVVHGGPDIRRATRLEPSVIEVIERYGEFSPLHNPVQLEGIKVAKEVFGENKAQFAVFDTAFHRDIPKAAATYAGPYDWVEQGIVRYGFHGSSFRYASRKAAEIVGRLDDPEFKVVVCHLGGGCSLAAVQGGRCVDTTMGFTPLDGVAMCTRSGSVDPGILIYLLKGGASPEQLERVLNKESGLAGLSGLPGDTRVILPESKKGNDRAALAIDVFVHRLQSGIGAMIASLAGLHAIVFTDVIGESEPEIRARACEPFAFFGMKLQSQLNKSGARDIDIAEADSKVRVMVVQSQEDWQVAAESYSCWRATAGKTP